MIETDKIIIGFSTSARQWSVLSYIIRKVERTPYSHVYCRFYSRNLDRWLIYHASQTNVHFNNIETFVNKNDVLEEYVINTTTERRYAAMRECIDHVGVPYGRMQLVGMGIVRLIKAWFGKKVKNPFMDKSRSQVCSEIVGRVLKVVNAPIDVSLLEYEGPRYIHQVIKQMEKDGRAQRRI